jgi:hypothetical protein
VCPLSRGGAYRAPEHLERHVHDLLRGSRKLTIVALLGRHHLARLLWKSRHLRQMLRHQRERFDRSGFIAYSPEISD